MRFHFSDAERLRRLAKLLKHELAVRGTDWPLHLCRLATARACGYPDFHEAESSAGNAPPSPVDEAVGPAVLADRLSHQRDALLGMGLAPGLAEDLVRAVGFTAARGGRVRTRPPAADPTPRQRRIAASNGGRKLRAGNFVSHGLLSPSGEFVGICVGTDKCHEHMEPPEGVLEALGVPDGARTVGEARVHGRNARAIHHIIALGEGGRSMVRLGDDLERVGPCPEAEDFAGEPSRRLWRSVPRPRPLGIVSGWSYNEIALVGFGGWRDRISKIVWDVHSGDLAVIGKNGVIARF